MAQETKSALTVFRDMVERQTSQFMQVMPEATVNRFKRTLMTMYQERKEVRDCEPMSILHVAMRAAQDGLMLDGVEAAVVPFRDRDAGKVTATYLPMIQGIRKKVRNSGLVLDWNVTPVFEGDECTISLGTNEYVHHTPSMTGGRKRPLLGVYSIARFRGGGQSIRWMNRDEIEDIRSKSKAKSGPWQDPIFYPEMAVKTCARAHAKQLPQSSDMQAFWARDDEDNGPDFMAQGSVPAAPSKRIASVADALDEFGAGNAPKLSAPVDSAPHTADDTASGPDGGATGEQESARGPNATDGKSTNDKQFDSVKRAYVRGQQDRRAGKPDEVPTEYATNDRNREQIAWAAGYDGKSMPEWRT